MAEIVISVDGVIAPFGTVHTYDIGVFFSPGTDLTGATFNVTWTFNDAVLQTGVLTINSHSITYGHGLHDVLQFSPLYVNTTMVPGSLAINTYEHAANPSAPFGLMGGFRYNDLNGYFMINNFEINGVHYDPIHVPGPILGGGIPGLILLAFLLWRTHERLSRHS